jgi:hypothetical protein
MMKGAVNGLKKQYMFMEMPIMAFGLMEHVGILSGREKQTDKLFKFNKKQYN